ncbi:MAG: histidinol dehydrogenase, partial [Acidimicrobiia bacterium]
GNLYVTLAKREVAGLVGVEAAAGPSELVVIADDSTPPSYVAVDLVAQAEHGPHGAAYLVTWSEGLASAVEEAVAELTASSTRRAEVEATLSEGGRNILVDGSEQALEVANAVAPEHLELLTTNPEALLASVRNAGAVFCGLFSPAAVGDYVAGSNHVLPTSGTARFSSSLRVSDFLRHLTVVSLDQAALARVAPHILAIAEVEGLEAHGLSVATRTRPYGGVAWSG